MTERIYTLIVRHLIGKATPEEESQMEQWLSEDDSHRQEYQHIVESDDFHQRYTAYDQFDADKAWKEFSARHYHDDTNSSRRPHTLKWVFRVAAVLLLLIVGGYVYNYRHVVELPVLSEQATKALEQSRECGRSEALLIIAGSSKAVSVDSEEMIEAMSQEISRQSSTVNNEEEFDNRYTLTTENGKEFWVTLDDGSKVHMNYGTQLKCPVRFDRDNRTVYLRGEAYFQVTKDKSRPFRVLTDQGVTTVYGTAFNVSTTEEPGCTRVVLVEGSVGLTPAHGHEIMMQPGQMGQMNSTDQGVTLSRVDTDIYTSWNEGSYRFNDCRLDKLMQVLGHWYGKRVNFESNDARGVLFTGSIGRYKSLSSALHAIEFATGLSVTEQDNEIIIK